MRLTATWTTPGATSHRFNRAGVMCQGFQSARRPIAGCPHVVVAVRGAPDVEFRPAAGHKHRFAAVRQFGNRAIGAIKGHAEIFAGNDDLFVIFLYIQRLRIGSFRSAEAGLADSGKRNWPTATSSPALAHNSSLGNTKANRR